MSLALGGQYGGYGGQIGGMTTMDVKITVTNTAPEYGHFLTPVWFGVHDGSFDMFTAGEPAPYFMEPLAEDGTVDAITEAFDEFIDTGAGVAQGTILGEMVEPIGPLAPEEMGSATFTVSLDPTSNYYVSFASMVLPSNDAFIGNGDPLAYPIVEKGEFVGTSFVVPGSRVYDAGTEINDEIPENTAFFSQMEPNTGVTQGGLVQLHQGLLPHGSGGILDSEQFANADFTVRGYEMAYITVEKA